jgi:Tfp pilus assembly protein PilF
MFQVCLMVRFLSPAACFRFLRRRLTALYSLVGILLLLGLAAYVYGPSIRAWYHFRQAEQAAARYDFTQALTHLDACRALTSPRPQVALLAARLARRSGAYSTAIRWQREYQQLDDSDAETLRLERLLLECQNGKMAASTESMLLARVRQGDPDSPLILEALAQGCVAQDRLQAAEHYLMDCLERQPENAQALLLLGHIKDALSLPAGAVEFYRGIVDAYPEHQEGRLRLAQSLLNAGSAVEAAEQFAFLAQNRPNDPAVRLGLALCRAEQGEVAAASQELDALIAENPRDKTTLMERSRLALAADHAALAEGWLRQALALDPWDRRTNYLLFIALKQQGKDAEAGKQKLRSDRLLADLRRLGVVQSEEMDKRPNDPALLCELGTLYLRNGQEAKGVYWLRRALEQDHGYGPAREALAHYQQRKSQIDE